VCVRRARGGLKEKKEERKGSIKYRILPRNRDIFHTLPWEEGGGNQKCRRRSRPLESTVGCGEKDKKKRTNR